MKNYLQKRTKSQSSDLAYPAPHLFLSAPGDCGAEREGDDMAPGAGPRPKHAGAGEPGF